MVNNKDVGGKSVVTRKPLKEVGTRIESLENPKVLFVMHMPPPVHGAAMIGQTIKKSDLINKLFNCNYINLTTASSIRDIGRYNLRKIASFFKLILNIYKAVERINPELVYITPNAKGGAFFKDFLVIQLLKLLKVKVVAHYHNKGVSTKQNVKVYDFCYRLFFKGLKVILLSPILYKDIETYVKPTDVVFCANGIAESNPGMKFTRSNTLPKILFLSNLIETKGVIVLLDALRILKTRGHLFECTFVGAESQEITSCRFNALIKERGLKGYAIYVGKKYGEEKQVIYNESDIFVFPTFYHNECFPLVLLEAMASALPCISTDEGAISDIIDDGVTGFVVERKNPKQLAEKIEILLNDKKIREEMGNAGKIKFEHEFSQNVFENRIVDILYNCIESHWS